MKTLLLLRHGKSSWQESGLADHERPLNKRGLRDAPRMGKLLKKKSLTPDVILSSTALRARTTAEVVSEKSKHRGEVLLDDRLYLASPETIVEILREVSPVDSTKVMVVGHNPGLENIVRSLTGKSEFFPTAALAQIELPLKDWSELALAEKAGRLVDLWRPRELEMH